jgi:hypothetical protein
MSRLPETAKPDFPDAVAELTGLHGAFSFSELLLQQIWLRGEFDATALRLRDGRALHLKKRGRWNRLAGPDFRDAEFCIENADGAGGFDRSGAETIRGDIEVHLRAQDWDTHGHARDPAYAGVKLHVVLFPAPRSFTEGAAGTRIPILELLPRLEKDIEAYAEEAAVEGIAGRPFSQLRAALAGVSVEDLAGAVSRHSARRWAAKVQLARRRIERLGWDGACHQAALEVLGYRPNRDPMLAVAEAFPLAHWRGADPAALVEEAWNFQSENWRQGGVRPANLPRRRLAQYARWVAARPDWPVALLSLGAALVERAGTTGRKPSHGTLREWLIEEICAGEVGGTRFDTWWCDAALPLLAAKKPEAACADGRAADAADEFRAAALQRYWQGWTIGDAPAELVKLAREFGVGAPSSKDRAILRQGELQGLLGWLATLANRQP